MRLRPLCSLILATSCTGSSMPTDAGVPTHDAQAIDAAHDASAMSRLTGFVVAGSLSPGVAPVGTSYVLHLADGAGPSGATIGSPCTTGNDCAALGAHAACFVGASGGFCTIDCDLDPEGPSVICPDGAYCFTGIRADGGRMCLPHCASDADCASGLCAGSLGTFNIAAGHAHACFPSCTTDADCNADSSGLACDTAHHRCIAPREVLGGACATNADCLGLGPSALCMTSTRAASSSYCTVACDPAAGCPGTLGSCVSGYASTMDGTDVAVCLGACRSEAECQIASHNTCSFVPSLAADVCTIACSSDADCIDGQCNAATGDCRDGTPFSTHCASDSNCAGGLCVADFHHPAIANCTSRCMTDTECPSGAVCVTSPVATDGAGEHIAPGEGTGDVGFCAPACTVGGAPCTDSTTTCLASHDPPEIDFAGSGSASSAFCWR